MDYRTGRADRRPERDLRTPLLLGILGGVVLIAALLYFGLSAVMGGFSQPTPEEVVEQFQNEGLEVGDAYPVEEEPQYEQSPAPKVEKSGVRFVIPSSCANSECGGRVFIFETEEDLETMLGYYEGLNNFEMLGGNLGGYTYRNGLLLLQIGSDTRKNEADAYGEVFENM